MENKEYLSSSKACEELDICKQTLYRWHREKILVPVKIHPHTKYRHYSKEQIEEFKKKDKDDLTRSC